MKPAFGDSNALFMGLVEQQNAWSIWMRRDFAFVSISFIHMHGAIVVS